MKLTEPLHPFPFSNRRYLLILGVLAITQFAMHPSISATEDDEDPVLPVSLTPDTASSGDQVFIDGSGFGEDPTNLYAWIKTEQSGFELKVTQTTDTRISTVVGTITEEVPGSIEIWKGQRFSPSDHTVLSGGKLFTISEASIFIGRKAASGPSFTPLGTSTGSQGGRLVAGILIVPVDPVGASCIPPVVRVSATVETGKDPGGPGGGDDQEPDWGNSPGHSSSGEEPGLRIALSFEISVDAEPVTSAQLTTAMAELINRQFGSLGFSALATTNEVSLAHTFGIVAGHITLNY